MVNQDRNLLKFWGTTEDEAKEGIVIPYIYIAGYDTSIQPLHIEDEGFSSANILHDGDIVLWTIIPSSAKQTLEDALVDYFWNPLENIEPPRLSLYKNYIRQELRHKRLFIKKEFFKQYNIPHRIFPQNVGEMVVGKL